jgi:5-methylcytosine-specific restriction endonuclease McrA
VISFLRFFLPRRYWYRHFYLRSRHWDLVRKAAYKRSGYKCAACGAHTRLDAHHLTYAHIGHELDDEVVAVCRDCHTKLGSGAKLHFKASS